MGFNFRKSMSIAKGIRLNFGKKGLSSISIGKRGASVNVSKSGPKARIGVPGTGMSYTTGSPSKKRRAKNAEPKIDPETGEEIKPPFWERAFPVLVTVVIVLVVGAAVIATIYQAVKAILSES